MHRIAILAVILAVVATAQDVPLISAAGVVRGADGYDASFNGVARGSQFCIWGANLAPSAASAAAPPLTTTLNGVRVKISTNGGQEWYAPLLYVAPNQINAILPSAVPEGSQSLVVEVNGVASASAPITVVTRQFAAFSKGSLGFGPLVLLQYDSAGAFTYNSFANPATPGQAAVILGTGLGPLPDGADDSTNPGIVDLSTDVTIYVGDTPVKPFYAGRAPMLPGIDQVNFYLPDSLPSRCYEPLTVVVGGVASGPLTFSSGTAGVECASELGLTADQLQRLDQGGTLRTAVLSVDTEASYGNTAQTTEAWIADYNAADLSLLVSGWQSPPVRPVGDCERSASKTWNYSASQGVVSVAPALAHIYGQVVTAPSAWVQLAGSSGCSQEVFSWPDGVWRSSPSSDCIASRYALFTNQGGTEVVVTSNDLPAIRQPAWDDWITYTIQPDGTGLAAWGLPPSQPDDQLILRLDAAYSFRFMPGMYTDTDHSMTCTLPPATGNFAIPFDGATFLDLGPPPTTGQIEASAPMRQLYPIPLNIFTIDGIEPEFTLVLIRNGISAHSVP